MTNADLAHHAYEGNPGQSCPVIRRNPKTGERDQSLLTWGLVPHDTPSLSTAPRPLWARAETVATTPMFADAYLRRRAIIPATTIFFRSDGGRYGLSRTDRAPMAWAGLWEGYRAPDGQIIRSYCALTVEANTDVSAHIDRMPLILEREDWPLWLGETEGDPTVLLHAPAAGIVTCRLISRSSKTAR